MYVPKLTDFDPFSLERLLQTCFDLPSDSIKCCVLIDLDDPTLVISKKFLELEGLEVQKRAVTHFYDPLSGDLGKKLDISCCDLFSFKTTGGSNLDPENEAWFFKLKIKDKNELDSLMNKEEYDKFAKESGS